MSLSRLSVRRPIAMTALIIVMVMIGASLYEKISIDLLPNMEIPIGVITSVIGAPIFVYMMIRKSYGFGGR